MMKHADQKEKNGISRHYAHRKSNCNCNAITFLQDMDKEKRIREKYIYYNNKIIRTTIIKSIDNAIAHASEYPQLAPTAFQISVLAMW